MTTETSIPYFSAKSFKDVIRANSSSFFLAFNFMGAKKARALKTFYAFARIVDDCVDEMDTVQNKRMALDYWKNQLSLALQHQPAHPVMLELAVIADNYQIPPQVFHGLVRGCEMDLEKNRYETFEETLEYCYHVASLIGVASIHIFGDTSPAALKMVDDLGKAFQLTNILRDIHEDFRRDRIYIARVDMAEFQAHENELELPEMSLSWQKLQKEYLRRAELFYQQAMTYLNHDPHRCLKPARVMAAVYYKILMKLKKSGFKNTNENVKLSTIEKIFCMLGLSSAR